MAGSSGGSASGLTLTQAELAERAALSERTVSDQERGEKQTVQADTAMQLADALKLPNAEREAFLEAGRETRRARTRRRARQVWAPAAPARIGRETEIADIAAALRSPQTRLVTLTGPGGAGKSRLALAVGAEVETEFEQLAYLNAMPLDAATQLIPTLASVLARPGGEPPDSPSAWDRVVGVLARGRALLLLDDLDRLPEAVTEIVELLAACPQLTILATSQTPLRIRAERQIAIAPLALPASWQGDGWDAAPAVTLFMERGRRVQRGLEITVETAPAIFQICHACDGVPLALELAAAQLGALPLPALAAAWPISEPATEPLRDLPLRQRSLAAAIRWSVATLSAPEQQVFRRLAVLTGFSVAQAGAVAAAPRRGMAPACWRPCTRVDCCRRRRTSGISCCGRCRKWRNAWRKRPASGKTRPRRTPGASAAWQNVRKRRSAALTSGAPVTNWNSISPISGRRWRGACATMAIWRCVLPAGWRPSGSCRAT